MSRLAVLLHTLNMIGSVAFPVLTGLSTPGDLWKSFAWAYALVVIHAGRERWTARTA